MPNICSFVEDQPLLVLPNQSFIILNYRMNLEPQGCQQYVASSTLHVTFFCPLKKLGKGVINTTRYFPNVSYSQHNLPQPIVVSYRTKTKSALLQRTGPKSREKVESFTCIISCCNDCAFIFRTPFDNFHQALPSLSPGD